MKRTTSRFSSTSPYSNNEVSWEIYRRQGWNATDTDGDAGSEAGMAASADFTYGGNVSSYVYRSMKAQASIRYEYQYLYAGSSLTLHLSTDTMTVSQLLKILP